MDEWKGKKCYRERVTGTEWYERRRFKKGEGEWGIKAKRVLKREGLN